VLEGELPCVEHEAGCGEFVFFSVDRIAEYGGADVVEMDANLVSAAGMQVAADEGGFCGEIGCEDFVIGDRGFACGWGDDCHFLAVDRVATDVGENGVLVLLRDAVGYRQVEFFHGGALGKLCNERLVGDVGFGDDEAARGVFVQAVDDAGALDTADAGELAFAMVKEGIDQGAVGISRSRVNDHAMRFVQDDEVIVLENDVQWDILGAGDIRHSLGDDDGDGVTLFHRVARLRRLAVDKNVLLADQRLDAGAGEVGQA